MNRHPLSAIALQLLLGDAMRPMLQEVRHDR